jgi:hypothetical protein
LGIVVRDNPIKRMGPMLHSVVIVNTLESSASISAFTSINRFLPE